MSERAEALASLLRAHHGDCLGWRGVPPVGDYLPLAATLLGVPTAARALWEVRALAAFKEAEHAV